MKLTDGYSDAMAHALRELRPYLFELSYMDRPLPERREALVALDLDTGRVVGDFLLGKVGEGSVSFVEMNDLWQSYGRPLVSVHTHPRRGTFSPQDLLAHVGANHLGHPTLPVTFGKLIVLAPDEWYEMGLTAEVTMDTAMAISELAHQTVDLAIAQTYPQYLRVEMSEWGERRISFDRTAALAQHDDAGEIMVAEAHEFWQQVARTSDGRMTYRSGTE